MWQRMESAQTAPISRSAAAALSVRGAASALRNSSLMLKYCAGLRAPAASIRIVVPAGSARNRPMEGERLRHASEEIKAGDAGHVLRCVDPPALEQRADQRREAERRPSSA
jgi:hypothetical protein